MMMIRFPLLWQCLVAGWVLNGSVAYAETAPPPDDLLFLIGKPDACAGEMGYGENGYRSFPDHYREPVVYVVGRDSPPDWPFIHPAHRDSWAGGQAYTYTIEFQVTAPEPAPACLVLGLAGSHDTERSRVSVTVNELALPTQIAPGGVQYPAFDPAAIGEAKTLLFEVPAGTLRQGHNSITIRLDEQSWILYDYVALRRHHAPLPIERPDLRTQVPEGIDTVIFAVRQIHDDPHWYANFGYYAEGPQRKAYGGYGRLCRLDLRTGKTVSLVDDPEGSVRDPQVHYDGKTIVFSYRPGGSEHFHLYEIQADGSGLRQVTDGAYDDFEPTYLPDGDIAFVSSRCRRWVNCWLTQVAVLHRCDREGGNMRQISANIEHDNTPWPLPDGRLLYQRWEYVDRSQVHYHHLWTTNPDGTGQMVYYGNLRPGIVMIDAKPIPDSEDVVAIFSPGHGQKEHAGAVTIVSPKQGPDAPDAARRVTRGEGFRDPYPLGDQVFLAARGNQILLLDERGVATTVYQISGDDFPADVWCHEPRPLVTRAREKVIPPRTRPAQSTGTLFLANVNEGRRMDGVERGEITQLLVMESLPKPVNYTGGMDPLSYGGTFTLPRLLGTVPVEPDGSAYFEVPAQRSLFFIALDKNQQSIKRMQSFTSVMPGEVTSCVGCHEHRTRTPSPTAASLADRRPPSQIEPLAGIPDVFDFPRDIQPLLDRHCVECHNNQRADGRVLLTGDRGPMFSHSYYTLTFTRQFVDGRNNPESNHAPRSIGAVASPLMDKFSPRHYDVSPSPEELNLVRFWIEAGAHYPGTYGALGSGMIGGYYENNQVGTDGDWPETAGASEAIRRRCLACHQQGRRLPLNLADEIGLSFWRPDWSDPRFPFSRHRVFNLTHPEESLVLSAPLSADAGGLGICRVPAGEEQEMPVFLDRQDADYQRILALCTAGERHLARIKRFDMPGFRPPTPYLREMKRYGVLTEDANLAETPVDCYRLDRAYWDLVAGGPPPRER